MDSNLQREEFSNNQKMKNPHLQKLFLPEKLGPLAKPRKLQFRFRCTEMMKMWNNSHQQANVVPEAVRAKLQRSVSARRASTTPGATRASEHAVS